MEHKLIALNEDTIGCTCGKWSHIVRYNTTDKEMAAFHRAHKSNVNRKARDQAYRDCGLVKVHGGLGGTYWE
jgi:hypothetical protein